MKVFNIVKALIPAIKYWKISSILMVIVAGSSCLSSIYASSYSDSVTSRPTLISFQDDTTKLNDPERKRQWDFGVMGGFLFSTIEGDLTEQHSYIGDFSAGIYGSVELYPALGLLVELYYAGLGTGFVSFADSKLHFNYLVLPVMFTYEFRPRFTTVLGPYFGLLISAKDEGDDFKEDITDQIASLDVGIKVGVYYQISEVVNLGASFNRGFINTQGGNRSSTFKQYNQSVMLTTAINLTKLLKK